MFIKNNFKKLEIIKTLFLNKFLNILPFKIISNRSKSSKEIVLSNTYYFLKLIEQNRLDYRSRVSLANLLIELGKLDNAIYQLSISYQLSPEKDNIAHKISCLLMAQGKISEAQKWICRSRIKNDDVPNSSNLHSIVISNNNSLNINNPFSKYLKLDEIDTFNLDFAIDNIKVLIVEIDKSSLNDNKIYELFSKNSEFLIKKFYNIEFIIMNNIQDHGIKNSKIYNMFNNNKFALINEKVFLNEKLIKNFYLNFDNDNYFCFAREYG